MQQDTPKRRQTISCGACAYRFTDVNGTKVVNVLLVRPFEERDAWGIPKGHIDMGESARECAIREVFEETGMLVELEDPLPNVSTKYKDEEKTVYSFLARQTNIDTPAYPRDGENVDVRWFNVDDLPKLHFYQRPLMVYAVELLKQKLVSHVEEEP